jgi:hypothetical protein
MSKGKASLAELMGSVGSEKSNKLELRHLPQILGDALPDLPRNQVGRYRLVKALQQRFGDNFRSLPGVSSLVEQFDSEIDLEDKIEQIKAIKMRNIKRG